MLSSRNADVPRTPVRDMYTKSRGASDRLVATVPSGGSIGFDRLNNCPNTRFHAVNLFHSYFFRVTDKKLSTKLSTIMSAAQSLKGCNDSLTTSRASSSEDSDTDVLQFPISLPTACALLDVLIIAIACHYNAEADGTFKGTLGVVTLCRQLVRRKTSPSKFPGGCMYPRRWMR
ncbi:hypothetical protein BD769DRAFT_700943 [Suillus cothurnatus]|nr:hypothetical protein BD769DRAFT_700943 [Suillus cothurnatus]